MPLTPQITLTGTLFDLYGGKVTGGGVNIQLWNYGRLLPRISGTGMLARISPVEIVVDGTGIFSTPIWGNDVITPAGTYYTVTFLDDQGNVIQTNAYQLSGSGTQDISSLTPYDPNVVVIAGPTVFGNLVTIPYAANLAINGALGSTFDITLTGNVSTSTMTNVQAGAIYTFIFVQDSTGNRTFAWPSNCFDTTPPNNVANSISVQSFVARANGNLYAIAPMVWE